MVEVPVWVPEERLAEFYVLLGEWHGARGRAAPAKRARLRRGAKPTPSSSPGRYAPLAKFLADYSGGATELSFAEIEEILGVALPQSARRHRAYWANSKSTTQARGWVEAGWVVSSLDMDNERVSFVRGTQ